MSPIRWVCQAFLSDKAPFGSALHQQHNIRSLVTIAASLGRVAAPRCGLCQGHSQERCGLWQGEVWTLPGSDREL